MNNRKKLGAILLACAIFLCGCRIQIPEEVIPQGQFQQQGQQGQQGQQEEQQQQQQQEPGIDKDTKEVIMVYMVASNLETEAGLASGDIREMLKSGFDEEKMKVLICTGGCRRWWMDGIPEDECTVFEIKDGELEAVYTQQNDNMSERDTLREFINYSYANYEAENYGLVLWNHGGGAVLGFGADENYNYDELSVKELSRAIKGSKLVAEGRKFEWIGFDACLMGMLEVADALSPYANYMIASEETEAGDGWNYRCLDNVCDEEAYSGDEIADIFIDAYEDYYQHDSYYASDYTLACLDLSKTENAVAAFENLILAASDELASGGYSKIAQKRNATQDFGRIGTDGFYDTIDLYDLAKNLEGMYPGEARTLENVLDELIVCEASNISHAYGVAVYFPYSNKDYAEEWLDVYESLEFSETYLSFLRDFVATLSGEQIADWDIQQTTPTEDAESGSYFIQLSDEQVANFGGAEYSIWEEQEPGDFVCWISSSDVALTESGTLSAGFDGIVFGLGDTSGNCEYGSAFLMESTEDYDLYSMAVMYTRGDVQSGLEVGSAYIYFKVSEEHPDGQIVGIYDSLFEAEDTLLPNKNEVELKEGDYLALFCFAREIAFDEDGNILPFEDWGVVYYTSEEFQLQGDLAVQSGEFEPEGQTYCIFQIEDTQGNSYYTNPAQI